MRVVNELVNKTHVLVSSILLTSLYNHLNSYVKTIKLFLEIDLNTDEDVDRCFDRFQFNETLVMQSLVQGWCNKLVIVPCICNLKIVHWLFYLMSLGDGNFEQQVPETELDSSPYLVLWRQRHSPKHKITHKLPESHFKSQKTHNTTKLKHKLQKTCCISECGFVAARRDVKNMESVSLLTQELLYFTGCGFVEARRDVSL